jgi:signal transduction histidine kinase
VSSSGVPAQPAIDDLACGVLTVDAAGLVLYANGTIAEAVGRAVDDIVGEPIDALLPPASRIFFSTHVFPLLRVQGVAQEIYLPVLAADGTELPMLLNGRGRDTESGFAVDLVLAPMWQRNAMESELIATRDSAREAAAAKDRFLSIVSHELRSPLAGISGYADLLLRGTRGELSEGQRTYVERIRDAAGYQARLIEDILDFTALTGARELAATLVPLERVLARVEGLLAVRVEEEGRSLIRRPRPAPGVVRADERALQQILLNLATNALKYGAEGSPVHILSEHDGTLVEIRVVDAGEGIPADQLERIFEPFVRLAPSGADGRALKGIGLGLALSRDPARAMGGDITVTSVVGTGSTFVLALPGD